MNLSGRLSGFLILAAWLVPAIQAQAPPGENVTAVFSMDKDRQPMVSLDGRWRFHPGDDPHWADPAFDDSGWALINSTRGWSEQGYKNMSGIAWYRTRLEIPKGGQPLALYIPAIATSYQVFADGQMIGEFGGIPPHERAYESLPRTFKLPVHVPTHVHAAQFAIRVWHSPVRAMYVSGGLRSGILIGRSDVIDAYSALNSDRIIRQHISDIIFAFLSALAGLTSVALFAIRPREKEYFWFGAALLVNAAFQCFRIAIDFYPIPITLLDQVGILFDSASQLIFVGFYFYLLRAKRDWFFWFAVGSGVVFGVSQILIYATRPTSVALLLPLYLLMYYPSEIWVDILVVRRALKAFPDARLVMGPQLISSLFNLALGAAEAVDRMGRSSNAESIVDHTWQKPFPIAVDEIISFLFLLTMLAILIRRFGRTSLHEERLTTEMEAARTVQHVLIPDEIPSIPGFAIEAVYKPASEVGGDFFQIVPTPDGGLLAVIGDVSGKGMPAAMTVSLLVGTIRTLAHYTQSPGEILGAMNQRMLTRSQGGFTTCLVLCIDVNGALTVANAGHLPPYLNCVELKIENGLPLGLTEHSAYPITTLQLPPDARLTLMTDGVVEARSRAGELFGFERTQKIAMQSPESIASEARAFGQQDDITVLSLSFPHSPVLHAHP